MKKILFLLLTCLLFVACGDDDDEKGSLILSKNSCTLNNNSSYAIIDIKKGAGEYKLISSNGGVAKGAIDGGKIIVWGFTQGYTSIIVIDKDNNRAEIKVEVKENISRVVPSVSKVSIKKGDTKELKYPYGYPAYDGASYDIAVDGGGAISVSEIDGGLSVKGEKIGENVSIYLLKDMWPVDGFSIDVVEKYELYVNLLITSPFKGKEIEAYIYTGNGNYKVQSTDESVATATIGDYNGEMNNFYCNPAVIHIKALEVGECRITVTDGEGEEKEIKVRVL